MSVRLLDRFKAPEIRHVFLVVEWMSLAIFAVVVAVESTSILAEWANRVMLPHWFGYILLAGLFGLSCIFPIQWSLQWRRLYVALSTILILSAVLIGYSFDILLYLLIAKSCFLLNRRDLLVMIGLVGLVWNASQIWLVRQSLDILSQQPQEILNNQRLFFSTVFATIGFYIVICTFVLLLSFMILREQRSRARAEQLTKEVETLAATIERSRIAREIHDSLGHRLTALNVQIELAQKLQQRDPDRATQSIEIAQQLANQCLQDVRHAVHSMSDRNLDLNIALQSLLQPMRADPDLQLVVALNFPPLPPTISHQIYCIIQEGLTNIQRHAQATKIKLIGEFVDDRILVVIQDNGIGLNLDQAETGFGLRSMSERAQLIGGRLEVYSTQAVDYSTDSHQAQGTQIHLELPHSSNSI
jgi:signal transduction histidine kinase